MFYVYQIDDKFVKIKTNKKYKDGESMFLYQKTNIENASYWTSKQQAKSWKLVIDVKFPNAELKEAKLTLK